MSNRFFIAGDWGTSNLRLFLIDAEQGCLGRIDGPGISSLKSGEAEICLANLIGDWRQQYGPIPIILAGMVGSTIGWREVPYANCPAKAQDLLQLANKFSWNEHSVCILPGLKCINPQNAPDVMRGEEIQIFGLLAAQQSLNQGEQLFCLPGTHNKWVSIEQGQVKYFNTSLVGELFNVLSEHSILCRDSGHSQGADAKAFEQGLKQAREFSQHGLLQQLFETRSRQLSGEFNADDASSYMSGLIIGADVHGAVANKTQLKEIHIIGDNQLSLRYQKAIELYQLNCHVYSGETTVVAGLQLLQNLLSES